MAAISLKININLHLFKGRNIIYSFCILLGLATFEVWFVFPEVSWKLTVFQSLMLNTRYLQYCSECIQKVFPMTPLGNDAASSWWWEGSILWSSSFFSSPSRYELTHSSFAGGIYSNGKRIWALWPPQYELLLPNPLRPTSVPSPVRSSFPSQ